MRIKCCCIIIATLMFFVGCATVVSTEQETVQVKVVDECYKDSWTQMMQCGEVLVPIIHDAQYKIKVEYNGEIYTIDDYSTYNKYCDKISEYAYGILETTIYDDGTVRNRIIGLE